MSQSVGQKIKRDVTLPSSYCAYIDSSGSGKDGGITETVLAITLLVAVVLLFVR